MTPSPRQLDVLRFIESYVNENAYPPSTREICLFLGASSTMAATTHVRALIEKGLLERGGGPRTLRITQLGCLALEAC